MKVITRQFQSEDAKFFCDKHPDKECASQLQLTSWYGSQFDLNVAIAHLCDECVKDMYSFLLKEFKVKPKETCDW
jgi:hypothetical protein